MMNGHMMDKNLELEMDELREILTDAELGWWKADFDNKICYLSDFAANLIELECDKISFEAFFALIREDYRERIAKEFFSVQCVDVYDQTYPIYTKYGIKWVRSKLTRKKSDENGNRFALGFVQCVSDFDKMSIDRTFVQRMDNLLYQQNSISHSLLSFLRTDDMESVIKKILTDILQQFQGGRAYIFEFDKVARLQSCTYEVVDKGISSEKESLQNLPLEFSPWWVSQLISGKPIVLFSLDEIPPEAEYDRKILEAQGIKSIMAVPMTSRDGIWAYMGIDMVDHHRQWSNEDYQWFSSMTNITSICMELRKSEREAQEDRLFLRNLFKYMPVGYIRMKLIYDEEGAPVDYLFVDVNDMADNILKIRNYVGTRGSERDVNLNEQLRNMMTVLRTKSNLEINFRLEHLDKHCHSIMYSPCENEVITMFSDMTETFKAYEAMDRSEKMLRNIYNNLPVGIELYDKEGCLIDFNDKNLEIFGVDNRTEIMKLNLFDNLRFSDEIKERLGQHESLDFSYRYDFSEQKWHDKSKNRGSVNLITKMTPLYDSQNEFCNYLVINIDNTETTSAYSKIQEFEDFFSVIADFAKVGYFKWNPVTDEGFAISQWYKNVGEPEGKDLKEIVGIYRNYHPDDRKELNEFYSLALLGKAHDFRHEVRVRRPDGSWGWLRCNIMVKEYDPDNGIIEIVGVNFDITELKEVEEKLIVAKDKAEALDRLKSAFLANMSHEIRTPLNAIVGFSNLLVDTESIEERKQYIAIVQENNNLLLQLISDILDLSKIEAGTFDFVRDDVDVNRLCEEIICSLGIKTTEDVQIVFGEHLPDCHIYSDKNRLTQIVTNFITNALKFTSKGSITLSYRLTESKKEVEFSVTDTGIGIPRENLSSIFGRFVKLNSFVHGTGLGLSICKSIAEQMGGSIGVESEEGAGSRFWFTHPYVQMNQPEKSTSEQLTVKYSHKADHTGKPLILVAEDTESNYILISTLLRRDYNLIRAFNGQEAVAMYEEQKPELILMDMKMPVMDGIEATMKIREKDKNIPIIAVTAFAFDRDKQRTIEAGCDDYVSKPLSGAVLKEVIKKWI